MHLLSNTSRSKGNQTMKLGHSVNRIQLEDHFVEKLYTKCTGETIPRPLSKLSKLSMSLDQQCKTLNSLFLLYANLRANIKIKPNVQLNIKLFT